MAKIKRKQHIVRFCLQMERCKQTTCRRLLDNGVDNYELSWGFIYVCKVTVRNTLVRVHGLNYC
jgi:hypothetical protein